MWSFSFNISPFNDYSGLISFRLDCFDLLAVQGTHKSLLQHHNLKGSILQCSVFFYSSLLPVFLFLFLLLTYRSSLYILDSNLLSDKWFEDFSSIL